MRRLPAAPVAAVLAAVVAASAAPLAAQRPQPPRAPTAAQVLTGMPARAVLLEDVERSRQNVLKYLDAAPDSMVGYRPTPGVRTFGEQIAHAAGSNPLIVASAWKAQPRFRADTAAARTRAGLRALVDGAYADFARLVREAPDAQLAATGTFAGMTKTNWRWVSTALEHTTWTLGQTVPYLRANGVTPPQYLPF
jgi:hypothetical protein